MAKLADAQVSGSCGQPCGFESLHPHLASVPFSRVRFLRGADESLEGNANYCGFARGASECIGRKKGEGVRRDDALAKPKYSSAPRLDGNFDTRKVSRLPSFSYKNNKKQGFERKIILKTLLFWLRLLFLRNLIVKNMRYR